ncbi:MAG: DUF732 domain-containing protein [Actinoplanes sp.]
MGARQALVIGVALFALAGCTGGGDDKADGGGTAASPAAAPLATFSGSAEDSQKFVTVLRNLDADLVDDEPLAISNGVKACEELAAGKSDAETAQNLATSFEVDTATAQKIVVASKSNLCK